MRPTDKINQLIKHIHIKASAELDKRVYDSFANAPAKSKNRQSVPTQPILWRIIMKSNITKFAAAAVIVAAALVIYSQFGTSGVTWGALAQKIDGVKSVVYDLTTNAKIQGLTPAPVSTTITGKSYYSSEYGERSEQYMNDKLAMIMYANPVENLYLTVIPESKKYLKVTNKSQEEIKQIADKEDPRLWVKRMMSVEYKKLGRKNINGINVEGIESTDPKVMGGMFEKGIIRLWVEIGTDYPVRIEVDGTASGGQMQMSMVMDNFQWNVDLDPALFAPEIPDDYTSQEMTVSSVASEDEAITALRFYAELTQGRYPSGLSIMTFVKEVTETLSKIYGKEITTKQDEYTSKLESTYPILAFYTRLNATSKDVAYYGDKVTAENPKLVLMRWKVKEGIFHVIYGDLSTGDVTPEELAELEAAMSQ
jgi:hypothetical protein